MTKEFILKFPDRKEQTIVKCDPFIVLNVAKEYIERQADIKGFTCLICDSNENVLSVVLISENGSDTRLKSFVEADAPEDIVPDRWIDNKRD